MPRKLGTSGEGSAVYQKRVDPTGGAIQEFGTALGGLGKTISNVQAEKRYTEAKTKAAEAALTAKVDKEQAETAAKLYDKQAGFRLKTLTDQLGSGMLSSAETESLIKLYKHNEIKEVKANPKFERAVELGLIQNIHEERFVEVDEIGKSKIRESKARDTQANIDMLADIAVSSGSEYDLKETYDDAVARNIYSPSIAEKKYNEGVIKINNDAVRRDIATSTSVEELNEIYGELERGEIKGLGEGQEANLMVEAQNKGIAIITGQNAVSVKTQNSDYSNNLQTPESILTDENLSDYDKQMQLDRLRSKTVTGWQKLRGKKLGELAKKVNMFMTGGFWRAGGSAKDLNELIEWMNDNNVDPLVRTEVMDIVLDGEAGDNAKGFLRMDDNRTQVKYPSKIKTAMDQFSKDFNKYTKDLPPTQRANLLGEAYFQFYKNTSVVYRGIGKSSENVLMDVEMSGGVYPDIVDPLKDIKADYNVRQDLKKVNQAMGDVRTPLQKAQDERLEGSEIDFSEYEDFNPTPDEVNTVRYLLDKMTKDQAVRFIKQRRK